ncbi:MAG: MmgE/PrpD family protein [Pseudomonadota bacterium]
MDETRQLAAFCSAVSLSSLPPAVVHKAKLCILDYIANIYGSLELDTVWKVVNLIRSVEAAEKITALGCGFKTDIHQAAFINGTTAEAIEAQDGLRFGGNHPGAAVIPAALAVAEETGADGGALIAAVVAGYEAANRSAAAMHPWHTLNGFLPTGTCGTFGAAVAAAKLRGLDAEGLLNAVGNAGYLLPISMAEHLMGGYTIKIVQGGQAASAGIMAAGLAGAGVTGAPYVLEGSALNGGFTKITAAAPPTLARITDGLGEHYSIMDIYFKPYTACRHTHGAAQAALALAESRGVDPAAITEILVETYGIAELAVGKGVGADSSFVSAQFSIPYVVAVCLTDGALGPRQLAEKRIKDPALLALAAKVVVKTDEQFNSAYPGKTSSRITISFIDGTSVSEQVDIPTGDPRDPMDATAIGDKLYRFAGDRDRGKSSEIISLVLDLENQPDIRRLASLI